MPTFGSFSSLDDRELILRLAEPAAVVVEGDRAADLGGLLGDRADAGRLGLDPAPARSASVLVGSPPPVTQSCGLTLVPLEHVENAAGLVVRASPGNHQAVSSMPCFFSASISASNVGMCSAR